MSITQKKLRGLFSAAKKDLGGSSNLEKFLEALTELLGGPLLNFIAVPIPNPIPSTAIVTVTAGEDTIPVYELPPLGVGHVWQARLPADPSKNDAVTIKATESNFTVTTTDSTTIDDLNLWSPTGSGAGANGEVSVTLGFDGTQWRVVWWYTGVRLT